MALDALDALLAITKGGLEGAREVQKERNEALEKRIKKIQKNDFELAKSAHTSAVKEHVKRKAEVNAIKSAGSAYDRAYYYYKDIMGDDDDLAREKVRSAAESGKLPEITDEMINEYVGDEPILFDDSDVDYSQARARSVVSDLFGLEDDEPRGEAAIQEQRKGVAAQIAKLQSSGKPMQPSEMSTEGMEALPSYFRKDEKVPEWERKRAAKKAYLKDKYPDASDAQINDIMYTQEDMKVGPTGVYSTLDEAAAKVMGGDSELQAERYRNRQQAEVNMKNMKSYSMDRNRKDILMGMFDTSPIISELKLEPSSAAGLMANSANMQAELVRKGMDETIAAQVVVAVHEGAVAEGGLFSKGTFDATKVPQAQKIISLWKEDGYYQDKDRILNLVYPQMTTEETNNPVQLPPDVPRALYDSIKDRVSKEAYTGVTHEQIIAAARGYLKNKQAQ